MKAALPLITAALIALSMFTPTGAPPIAAQQQEINCDAPWLVLALPAQNDISAVLQAFYTLRARNTRTLVAARPDADPDMLRLFFADGHQLALMLDPNEDITAQVAAWEKTMSRLVGHPGLRLAHLPDGAELEAARAALNPLGYRPLIDAQATCPAPPKLAAVAIDANAQTTIYNQLAGGAVGHPAAGWQYTDALVEVTAPTPEAFRAAHVVVVDPGHTRMDRGASIQSAGGEYKTEHWSNVVRGRALRGELRARGWAAVMTHDDGWLFENPYNGADMDRDGIINNHDTLIFRAQFAYYVGLRNGRRPVIVMLHADSAGDPSVAGYTMFYPDPYETADDAASYRLALAMGDHLAQAWTGMGVSPTDRGIIPGRAYGREQGPGAIFDIIDWRFRELPAVRHEGPVPRFIGVLVETGTASHPAEAIHLATEKGNAWLAKAHAQALDQWMNIEIALTRFAQDGFHDPVPTTLTPPQIDALTYGEITHGSTDNPPRMAFTFDAGSTAALWPQLRDVLRERGVVTTIFLTGDFIRANPAVVRQMLADGHDLQNHSDTHPDFTQLSAPAIQAELRAAQAALDQAVGAHLPMRLWRPPFGARTEATWRAAAEIGLLSVWWSKTGDTTGWQQGATAESVTNWVVSNFQPGQIYVAHVNSVADVEAIGPILDAALAQGYAIGDLWSVVAPEQVAALKSAPSAASSE